MKPFDKLASLCLAALIALSLGTTAVFAATGDDTSGDVTTGDTATVDAATTDTATGDTTATDTATTDTATGGTTATDTATVDAATTDTAADTTSTAKSGSTKSSTKSKSRKSGTRVSVTSVAASVLGKTDAEVKESVKTGKVGDLLIAAGKVDTFKSEYLTQTQTALSAAVTAGTLTQTESDEKYATAKAKMDAYDGTTHLCGKSDHSEMSTSKKKSAD